MGKAKFTAVPNLDAIVAQLIVAPVVAEVVDDLVDTAKRNAPDTKEWVSLRDGLVRETHVRVDGQEVPSNLRFTLKSMDWDRKHRGLGPWTYMRQPRDQSSGAVVNIKNCRCSEVTIPNGMASTVGASDVEAIGARVRGTAFADGNLVVEAEFGTIYPGGLLAEGTHFMARAVAEVAARRGLVRSG